MPIPFNKIGQIFQTGRSTGPTDRHQIVGNPTPPNGIYVAPSHILATQAENALDIINSPRKCVLVLTPFMSEAPAAAARLTKYANLAVRNSIKRHEAPVSSNLFYYSSLNIHTSIEKDVGLQSMLSWIPNCDILAVYSDYGITNAMELCIKMAKMKGAHVEYRNVGQT